MIIFTKGDMFETPADIRVNTVNCVGVMGAGVALAFKTKYPAMFKEYKRECKAGNLKPGKLFIWKNLFGETVVNFPTKRHWNEPSRYEDIESGLTALHKFLSKEGNVKVTLPALGCGHGGLNWDNISKSIVKYLGNLEATIYVFEPSDSHNLNNCFRDKEIKEAEIALKEQGASILKQGDDNFPSSLKGTNLSNIYLKGNLSLLNSPIIAILSSLKPTDHEVNIALKYVERLAKPEISFMIGYDPSISRPIIKSALELGSNVIISFPEGLLNFKVRKDLENVWDEKRTCVVSFEKPNEKWRPTSISKAREFILNLSSCIIITDEKPRWLLNSKNDLKVKTPIFYIKYEEIDKVRSNFFDSISARPLADVEHIDEFHTQPIRESLKNSKNKR